MEDRLGVAVSLVNKIISRFASHDGDHVVWETFLKLMDWYKKGWLKNTEEISEKCALLFSGHSDILEELSPYFTSELPKSVQKKKRVQRVSSMGDNGGLKKSGSDKRKRYDQGFDGQGQVEFEETDNNLFQYGDYAEEGFKHFEKVRKQLCISVEYFQFLMYFSFRISRDELETTVAPSAVNMVDELPDKDPVLIKEFVHEFVGFCKYVEEHDRNLSAGRSIKEESDQQITEERKRRKVEKKQKQREGEEGGKSNIGEPEKISNGCPLVTVASKNPEEKSVVNHYLVSENSTGCNYYTKASKRNNYEEAALNRYEDERFELDIVLNQLRSAINHAEKLQTLLAENTRLASKTPIIVESYLTSLDLKCIQSVYRDQHKEVRDILGKNITVGLSAALSRMKQKRIQVLHSIKKTGVRF